MEMKILHYICVYIIVIHCVLYTQKVYNYMFRLMVDLMVF